MMQDLNGDLHIGTKLAAHQGETLSNQNCTYTINYTQELGVTSLWPYCIAIFTPKAVVLDIYSRAEQQPSYGARYTAGAAAPAHNWFCPPARRRSNDGRLPFTIAGLLLGCYTALIFATVTNARRGLHR